MIRHSCPEVDTDHKRRVRTFRLEQKLGTVDASDPTETVDHVRLRRPRSGMRGGRSIGWQHTRFGDGGLVSDAAAGGAGGSNQRQNNKEGNSHDNERTIRGR